MAHLLMLAMILLPWQALYAQTDMLVPSMNHKCEHAQMQQVEQAQHEMTCCEQDAGHCNQNCRDCFHCQSISAIITALALDIDQPYSSYSLPLHETHSGLPSAGQFRPPRTLV